MTEETYYVGVDSPTEVRRDLLISSRDLIRTLKQYEEIKKIRQEKVRVVDSLKEAMKELNSVHKRLKGTLPKTNIKIEPLGETKQKRLVAPSATHQPSKLQMLESELNKIEEQLRQL